MSQLSQFIGNHWPLVSALLLILVLIVINEVYGRKQQAARLSPQALVRHINNDNIPVYDLRPAEAFRAGHIVNASRVQKEEFDKTPMQKIKEQPFVLVCDSGNSSILLANSLKQKGFHQAMVLQGGMRAWQEADLPLIKGK